jgi:hypothetical protein
MKTCRVIRDSISVQLPSGWVSRFKAYIAPRQKTAGRAEKRNLHHNPRKFGEFTNVGGPLLVQTVVAPLFPESPS